MSSYEDNYLNKRPQSLCKMCGRCCRMSTTTKTYKELLALANSGDSGAKDFLEIFEPYESVEAAKKVDEETVENIINTLSAEENFDTTTITFYHCRYLKDDNLCSNYENRKILCKHFPSTPWAIVPPQCGFEGWLFMQREEIKQKVRREKEELIELQLLRNRTHDSESLKKIELVEQKLKRNIELYASHGSRDW